VVRVRVIDTDHLRLYKVLWSLDEMPAFESVTELFEFITEQREYMAGSYVGLLMS
jgi:hypothetical protein